MTRTLDQARDLIGGFYEAAHDRSRLSSFLDLAARAFGAHIVGLRIYDAGATNSHYFQSIGISAEDWQALEAPITGRNLWRIRGFPQLLRYGVAHDEMAMSRDELLKSDFYHDLIVPMGVGHGMGLCLWTSPPEHAAVLTINTPRGSRAYDDGDMRFAQTLLPHFRSAYSIMQRLSWADSLATSLDTAMQRLQIGVVFVDASATCVYLNVAADAAITAHRGLFRCARAILRCTDPGTQDVLHAAIRQAARGSLLAPQRIPIRDKIGKLSLMLVVSMVRGDLASLSPGNSPCAAIFIHVPSASPQSPETTLREVFKFTQSEARLASLLVTLGRVDRCAEALGISMPTARTHLRNLFAKTDTHRQAELVSAIEFVLKIG